MSEQILIYEEDREILTFLKSFFRKSRDFKVEFAPAQRSLTTPFTGPKTTGKNQVALYGTARRSRELSLRKRY